MREHRYQPDLPHSPARIWALMQDYERWDAYAPMVLRVAVLHPGDAGGNGLLLRLEPVGSGHTRLRFEERYHLTRLPWRWLEGPIYRFINRQNEQSMRRLSEWLTDHPEYRADLG